MEFFNAIHFKNEYWVLALPLIFIIVDIVTGYIVAWRDHNVSSSVMRSGIAKKAGEVLLVLSIEILTVALDLSPDITKFFSLLVTFTEINSNLENLIALGVPVPLSIKNRLANDLDDLTESEIPIKKKEGKK